MMYTPGIKVSATLNDRIRRKVMIFHNPKYPNINFSIIVEASNELDDSKLFKFVARAVAHNWVPEEGEAASTVLEEGPLSLTPIGAMEALNGMLRERMQRYEEAAGIVHEVSELEMKFLDED